LCCGIEAVDDIIADLNQALRKSATREVALAEARADA
jgi:hypothetical protein